jgi:hypothetical protein
MNDGYEVVNLGFAFEYFDKEYTQVSISTNGYVCLGNRTACRGLTWPWSYDIIFGLNANLDLIREGGGQIYYKNVDLISDDFKSSKILMNLFDPLYEPNQIFMITYDNFLSFDTDLTSMISYQIFLASSESNNKAFVTFKYTSCPTGIDSWQGSPALAYINNDGTWKEIKIGDGEQCTESNVGQTGIWVFDVTSRGE